MATYVTVINGQEQRRILLAPEELTRRVNRRPWGPEIAAARLADQRASHSGPAAAPALAQPPRPPAIRPEIATGWWIFDRYTGDDEGWNVHVCEVLGFITNAPNEVWCRWESDYWEVPDIHFRRQDGMEDLARRQNKGALRHPPSPDDDTRPADLGGSLMWGPRDGGCRNPGFGAPK